MALGPTYNRMSCFVLDMLRFQVLTAAGMKMAAFWDIVMCSLMFYRYLLPPSSG
jgi:hypothetical protein